jgi:hypothetical protein
MEKKSITQIRFIFIGTLIGVLLSFTIICLNPFLVPILLHDYYYMKFQESTEPDMIEKYAVLSCEYYPSYFIGKINRQSIDAIHFEKAISAFAQNSISNIAWDMFATKACKTMPLETVNQIIKYIPIEQRAFILLKLGIHKNKFLQEIKKIRQDTKKEIIDILSKKSSNREEDEKYKTGNSKEVKTDESQKAAE